MMNEKDKSKMKETHKKMQEEMDKVMGEMMDGKKPMMTSDMGKMPKGKDKK